MLEKPDIQDSLIIACLSEEYDLNITQLDFLPLGADVNTAVYRATSDNGASYFVKLRSGVFNEMSILVPKLLHDQHIESIIPPLPTRSQGLWANVGDYKLMAFPFIEGRSGYEMRLSDRHWIDFGRALRALHTAMLPADVTERIPREHYSDHWRGMVARFQAMVEDTDFTDPIAAELAAFMRRKHDEISKLVHRAGQLAAVLQAQDAPFVVCHADIHAANILIDASDHLYMVDWDTLTLAPKERDLMFVGGGQFLNQRPPEDEERLFYQGYGETATNPVALAYYRYERIVVDIAEFCQQLLLTDEGGEDRANSLRYMIGQFERGGVIDMAYRSEAALPPGV